MICVNQSKLTPTLSRTQTGGTLTWEQLQNNNSCL